MRTFNLTTKLYQSCSAPLGKRLHMGRVVMRVDVGRNDLEVDAFNAALVVERWQVDQNIITQHDRPCATPCWDNVIYCDGNHGSHPGLGYVATKHQGLQSVLGATVLTYCRAIGIDRPSENPL